MTLQPHERVLIDGGRRELPGFGNSKYCVVVDWRDDVATILGVVKAKLPDGYLDYQRVDAERWEVHCRGARHTLVASNDEHTERVLRSINRLLMPEYEMRIFTPTMGDGYSLLVRPAKWWSDFSSAYGSRARKLFVTTDERVDVTGTDLPRTSTQDSYATVIFRTVVRKRGLKWLSLALGLDAGSLLLLWYLSFRNFGAWRFLLLVPIGLSLPFVLIGGLETSSGIPLLVWEQRWWRLAGWQRGVLGTLAVLLILFSVILGVAAVFTWIIK